jgi:sugar O-acyltransferase (sialic acid O-acetyltransferase NeuD family)
VTRRIVVGAGAQGRVVLDNWRAQHPKDTFAFVDDDAPRHGTVILGATILGPLADLPKLGGEAILAIGNNQARLRIAAQWDGKVAWGRVVHPSAVVMPSSTIGPGTVVFAGAVVNTQAELGAHVIVNTGSIIEHDSVFEDYASVSPGCRMGGRVHAGRGVFLGAGVTLAPRVRIGEWTIVGAGAVVLRDIPERSVAYGVPARVVRPVVDADWSRVL